MSHSDSTATLQGAQMAAGRTKKAYQVKADELTATSAKLVHLDQVIGEKLADDLDATADIHERHRLQALVQQLKLAVSILRQRKDEAETAMKQADQTAVVEREVAVLTHNKAVSLRIDQWLEEGHQLAREKARAVEEVRACDAGFYGSYLTDERLQFQLFVNLNAHPVTGVGHVPGPFMKFQKFSECAPSLDLARTRKRA